MSAETLVSRPEPRPVERRPGDGSATVTVVYFSRYRGATAALAAAVAEGAARVPDVSVHCVSTTDVDQHWALLHSSDALIFGSPTYVGGVAARFKDFIESCAGDVWVRRLWLNKLAGGFTVSSGRSGDKLHCLMDLLVFAMQMGMIWVPVPVTGGNYSTRGSEADLNRMAGYLGVMAQANIDEPTSLAPPTSDLETASLYGEHVAWNARQLVLGRALLPGGREPGIPAPGVPDTLFDSLPAAVVGQRIPGDRQGR